MAAKYELGIVDTRNIIKSIKEKYNFNFKNYALTFFKRRVELIIEKYNLKNADNFIRRIEDDKDFFEIFLKEICVEITELFRDPSLWRFLKDDFFPGVIPKNTQYKIWFPEVSSGEELYSVAILLDYLGLLDNVLFLVSSISQIHLNKIQEGYFDYSKIDVNESNYKRIIGDKPLSDYYTIEDESAYIDISLLKNIKFIKQNTIFEQYPKGIKLIFYRNHLLYFNQILEERLLKSLYNCLVPGGHLIIGMNEKIDYWNSEKDYILVNENEKIYKKKLA